MRWNSNIQVLAIQLLVGQKSAKYFEKTDYWMNDWSFNEIFNLNYLCYIEEVLIAECMKLGLFQQYARKGLKIACERMVFQQKISINHQSSISFNFKMKDTRALESWPQLRTLFYCIIQGIHSIRNIYL